MSTNPDFETKHPRNLRGEFASKPDAHAQAMGELGAETGAGSGDVLPANGVAVSHKRGCACSVTSRGTLSSSTLCPLHAAEDPCQTQSQITGRRRKGTLRHRKGCSSCTSCGWTKYPYGQESTRAMLLELDGRGEAEDWARGARIGVNTAAASVEREIKEDGAAMLGLIDVNDFLLRIEQDGALKGEDFLSGEDTRCEYYADIARRLTGPGIKTPEYVVGLINGSNL